MVSQWVIVMYWDDYRDGHGLAVVDRSMVSKSLAIDAIASLDPYDLEDDQNVLHRVWDNYAGDMSRARVSYYYEDEDGDEHEDSSSFIVLPYTLQSYYKNKYFPGLKLPKNEVMYDLKRRQTG